MLPPSLSSECKQLHLPCLRTPPEKINPAVNFLSFSRTALDYFEIFGGLELISFWNLLMQGALGALSWMGNENEKEKSGVRPFFGQNTSENLEVFCFRVPLSEGLRRWKLPWGVGISGRFTVDQVFTKPFRISILGDHSLRLVRIERFWGNWSICPLLVFVYFDGFALNSCDLM